MNIRSNGPAPSAASCGSASSAGPTRSSTTVGQPGARDVGARRPRRGAGRPRASPAGRRRAGRAPARSCCSRRACRPRGSARAPSMRASRCSSWPCGASRRSPAARRGARPQRLVEHGVRADELLGRRSGRRPPKRSPLRRAPPMLASTGPGRTEAPAPRREAAPLVRLPAAHAPASRCSRSIGSAERKFSSTTIAADSWSPRARWSTISSCICAERTRTWASIMYVRS